MRLRRRTVQLEYPSDLTVNGLAFGPLAERIEANLDEVGIKIELVPGPVATTLENYRAGKEQMGLWLWNPDYPDPQDYLVFGPGGLVGLRAGWAEGAAPDIEAVSQQAATTVDDATRAPLYEQFQQQLNESGPFFPLFQPEAVGGVGDRPGVQRRVPPDVAARRPPSRSRVIPAMSDDDRMRGHHRWSRSRRR